MAENYNFLRSFTFDGSETSHLFQIAKVNIPFMAKENEMMQVGNTDGKHFMSTRVSETGITIDGFLIKDNSKMNIYDTKDQLVRILNSDEPKQLVFDIFPTRYFNAIYTGVQEYDATDPQYTPVTLVFDVPDGLAHSIEPSGFSNVYTTGTNLVLDSEFNNTKKYMNSWVRKLDEKFDGSNIVRGDMRFDINNVVDRNDQWFYRSPQNSRKIPELKKGDWVNFSAYIRVVEVDDVNKYAGSVALEEYTDGKKNEHVHFVRFDNKITDGFIKVGTVVQIEGDNTTGVGLSVGLYGEAIVDMSKPMLALSNTSINYVPSEEGVSDALVVQNNGTYRTYPNFTFTMNGENGLVALLKEDGSVLQFGNPEDVDGNISKRTEIGLRETFWGNTLNPNIIVNTGFKTVYPNMNSNPSTPNIVQGTLNMTQDPDAVVPVFTGVGDIGVWHGPTMMIPISAPSTNDRTGLVSTHTRFQFSNYDKAQRGRIEFSTFDEAGEPVMTAIVRDSSLSGNEMRLECWYKRQKLLDVGLDRKTFSKDFYEINMSRVGNELRWRLVQIRNVVNNPDGWDQASVDKEYKFTWKLDSPDKSQIMKYGIWQMRYSNKYHVLMKITDCQVRWENTPYYTDVKNYFQDGDIVEIDVQNRALYVNGVENTELNVVGNEWEKFRLELGETLIQPVVSDWANMAEVTCALREAWL